MLTKTAAVKVKAGPDSGLEEGQFEAIVSVFGNVDSDGDRVVKGAFAKSLKEWDASGDPLPVIFSHDHRDPFAHIGVVLDAKETNDGLWVKGQLDVGDEDDNKLAKQVYKLLKGNRLRNWSYAYDVVDYSHENGATELRELKVHEVGPTLIGANVDTTTLAIKASTKEAVSDANWSQFSNGDYTDEQYARACILDRGSDAGTAKQRYSLPVREPSGALNRAGCHAAASRINQVDATPEQKRAAARKLVGFYRSSLKEDPPEGLTELAKSALAVLNALLDEDPELVATLKSILRDDQRPPRDFRKALDEAAEQVARTHQALQDVLAKFGETEDDQAAASGAGPAKDDDPSGKSDEPSPQPSARVLAAHQQLALEGALYEHSD